MNVLTVTSYYEPLIVRLIEIKRESGTELITPRIQKLLEIE
jgi:hypothetical protein